MSPAQQRPHDLDTTDQIGTTGTAPGDEAEMALRTSDTTSSDQTAAAVPNAPDPHRRLKWGVIMIAVLLLTLLAVTGYVTTRPHPAAAPAPDTTAQQRTADEAAAVAAYQRQVALVDRAYVAHSTKGLGLEGVATDRVIAEDQSFIDNDIAAQVTFSGTTHVTAHVTNWQGFPDAQVVLAACADTSQTKSMFPDGRDARVGPHGEAKYNTRVPATVTVRETARDVWKVDAADARPDQAC